MQSVVIAWKPATQLLYWSFDHPTGVVVVAVLASAVVGAEGACLPAEVVDGRVALVDADFFVADGAGDVMFAGVGGGGADALGEGCVCVGSGC